MEVIFGLPPWGFYLIISLVMTYWLVIGGWALARAGRSPLWVLLLCIPWLNVAVVWMFAYAKWPAIDAVRGNGQRDGERDDGQENGDQGDDGR